MPGADQDPRAGTPGGRDELAAWAGAEQLRGEITLVVDGAPAASPDLAALREAMASRQVAGHSHRDAVAAEYGLRRRKVYQATLY